MAGHTLETSEVLRFFHIAVIILGFGATFTFPFLQAAAERRGVVATHFAMQVMIRVIRFLTIPAAILTLIFGTGLIFELDYDDDFPAWLMATITWYVVAIALIIFVVAPASRKAEKLLEGLPDGPDLPAAYLSLSKRMQIGGGLLGLSIIGITLVMVWKP